MSADILNAFPHSKAHHGFAVAVNINGRELILMAPTRSELFGPFHTIAGIPLQPSKVRAAIITSKQSFTEEGA